MIKKHGKKLVSEYLKDIVSKVTAVKVKIKDYEILFPVVKVPKKGIEKALDEQKAVLKINKLKATFTMKIKFNTSSKYLTASLIDTNGNEISRELIEVPFAPGDQLTLNYDLNVTL